jgi:hypothetical protein
MTKRKPSNARDAAERREAFDTKLALGRYRELFGEPLLTMFDEALDRLETVGMAEEIGSLRVVLARILAEESDLNRLATNVARIASVIVRAVQTHNDAAGETQTSLVEEFHRLLDEIDPEGESQ